MKNARKAYLVEFNPRSGRLAVTVQPVLVVFHEKGDKLATVVPFGVRLDGPWISPNAQARTVKVSDLASTRLRALAKLAVLLADVETYAAAELAFPPPERDAPGVTKPGPVTPAKSRRDRAPWYARD